MHDETGMQQSSMRVRGHFARVYRVINMMLCRVKEIGIGEPLTVWGLLGNIVM